MDTTQSYADVALENAKFTSQPTPEEVFAAFSEMAEEVQKMSREELEALSNEEILELGEPIRLATEGTIQLSEKTLQQLREPLGELTDRFLTMTREEHRALSSEIDKIISSDGDGDHERRSLTTDQIRDVLMELSGETMLFSSTCEQLFTMQGDRVILMPGDNFSLANSVCPAGTPYNITGTHYGQSVSSSKTGNSWVGGGSAVMDGQSSVNRAFSGGLHKNSISWFEIRNYWTHGIYTASGSNDEIEINNMTFKNIAPNQTGQDHGAIMILTSKDIEVRDSYFEDVASSIRIRDSQGPIKILDNEALNTGRNFFQCGNCTGAGIRINGNSMDYTSPYGAADLLEDWISIFKSSGTQNDPIQVNNNRARGHSGSDSGSFIMLGDHGGEYQEAIGNIGVNPGQVGIGAHGGEYMYVANNKMYSEAWFDSSTGSGSNVGFSSYNATTQYPCSNHDFDNNTANWTCGDAAHCSNPPTLNNKWSNGACGIWTSQMGVDYDSTMDETVWDEW